MPQVAATKRVDEGFPSRLQALMQRSGLSHAQLAERIGVDRGMVYKWLKGERVPQLRNIRALATEFGEDPLWLSHGQPRPMRPDEAVKAAEATKDDDPIGFDVAQIRHYADNSKLERAARGSEPCRALLRDLAKAVENYFRREEG